MHDTLDLTHLKIFNLWTQDAGQIEVSDKRENALHLQQVAADVIIANRTLDAFAGEGVVPMSKEEIEASVLAAKQVAAVLLPEWDTPGAQDGQDVSCLLYTSPSPRDQRGSRMPSSA